MSDLVEQTRFSQLLSQCRSAVRALDSMSELLRQLTDAFWPLATMARQLEHHTALIPLERSVPDQYTLKLTLSLTPRDMVWHSTALRYTPPIPPAIIALASSLTLEYHLLCLCGSIEILGPSNC